jgi:FMN phosphatase YigB (HAD superfamily)
VRLLRVPRHLPEERSQVNDVRAITFDYGNTLVQFASGSTSGTIERTAERLAPLLRVDAAEFVRAWGEERARQFATEVPLGLEADSEVRAARTLARLRGCPAPVPGSAWDSPDPFGYVEPAEIEAISETYTGIFVASTPVPPAIGPMLGRLAANHRLAIVSNWPLALAIERFADAAGWSAHLAAIVVSQRVGAIKPQPAIFEAAALGLGVTSGRGILHVGDDPGADVAGAHGVGWRAALVLRKPSDSPLPTAPPVAGERPDLEIETVLDLEAALGLHEAPLAP